MVCLSSAQLLLSQSNCIIRIETLPVAHFSPVNTWYSNTVKRATFISDWWNVHRMYCHLHICSVGSWIGDGSWLYNPDHSHAVPNLHPMKTAPSYCCHPQKLTQGEETFESTFMILVRRAPTPAFWASKPLRSDTGVLPCLYQCKGAHWKPNSSLHGKIASPSAVWRRKTNPPAKDQSDRPQKIPIRP